MTGAEIYLVFQNKIDKSYSAFINPTRANRLFKESLFTAISNKNKVLDDQKVYDELKLNISTNKIVTPNNNQVYTSNLAITGVTVSGLIVKVTTGLPHNFILGDTITISGVAATTNVNGTQTVNFLNSTTQFQFTAPATPAGSYTAGTGTVTSDKIIGDYMHLFTVKAKYTNQYYGINIINALSTTPIVLTLDNLTNLRTGEQITVSGVLGNTAANGTFYIRKVNNKMVSLFADKNLQTPVASSGTYTSGGIISRTNYQYCMYNYSDRKIGSYNTATVDSPKVELSKNLLKFYPLDETCQEITIDYLSTATVLPDVSNSSIDLEAYYPQKLLYYICDVAVDLFAKEVRDAQLTQTAGQNLVQNS